MVFTKLIITITVLLGSALSWAWGVITMEAAVARHASARGGKHHKSATICRGPDSQWIHIGYECDHHVFLHDGIVFLLYGKLHDPSSYYVKSLNKRTIPGPASRCIPQTHTRASNGFNCYCHLSQMPHRFCQPSMELLQRLSSFPAPSLPVLASSAISSFSLRPLRRKHSMVCGISSL